MFYRVRLFEASGIHCFLPNGIGPVSWNPYLHVKEASAHEGKPNIPSRLLLFSHMLAGLETASSTTPETCCSAINVQAAFYSTIAFPVCVTSAKPESRRNLHVMSRPPFNSQLGCTNRGLYSTETDDWAKMSRIESWLSSCILRDV